MEARAIILEADRIAEEKGLTQSQWSRNAGHANNGQTVSRMISKGDCRISTFLDLLEVLGCELEIKVKEKKETLSELLSDPGLETVSCTVRGE